MYLVGATHLCKRDSQQLLERCIAERQRLGTDVEVFQEILQRHVASDRRDAIQPAFDALSGVVDEIFAVELRDFERAKAIVLDNERLSARDARHVAVLEQHGIDKILSFDSGFDHFLGISRFP